MGVISKIEKSLLEDLEKERFNLTLDEVMDNICTEEIGIINSLYDLNRHLLTVEDERLTALDTKASSILGMAGVALALIFSLGGLLLDEIKNIDIFYLSTSYTLAILYIFTNFALLLSIVFAVFAIRARSDYKTVTDKDIFTKEIDKGENYYRRYIIAHFWQIYKNNFLVNEVKGYWLKRSHWSFAASMFLLLIISIIIGLYTLRVHGHI